MLQGIGKKWFNLETLIINTTSWQLGDNISVGDIVFEIDDEGDFYDHKTFILTSSSTEVEKFKISVEYEMETGIIVNIDGIWYFNSPNETYIFEQSLTNDILDRTSVNVTSTDNNGSEQLELTLPFSFTYIFAPLTLVVLNKKVKRVC